MSSAPEREVSDELLEQLIDEARRLRAAAERLERKIAKLPRRTQPAPRPVSDTDRAAARAVARKLGLIVRDSKR